MSKKVLLVDDAPILRLLLRDILEKNGYEVVAECSNGNEAVAKFKELRPDLVTLDIIMPEKTGLEALGEILKIDPNARIIMVTAIEDRESLMKALRSGANDYILKPFEEARVISAVKGTLDE